jgi:hypothetical protein
LVIHCTTFAASELIETEDKHVYASDLNWCINTCITNVYAINA